MPLLFAHAEQPRLLEGLQAGADDYLGKPFHMEELVARNVIVDEHPDVVINMIDATALERSLYLAVQFMEIGAPMVLGLNMMDEVKRNGVTIDVKKLSTLLGVPVVPCVARVGEGREELMKAVAAAYKASNGKWKPIQLSYGPELDPVIERMTAVIAAGTGLGEALLFWDGAGYHAQPTEGGHCSFAPTTADEDGLLAYMRKQLGGHVSVERVLSGPGLFNIWRYLSDAAQGKADAAALQAIETAADPAPKSLLALWRVRMRSAFTLWKCSAAFTAPKRPIWRSNPCPRRAC